MKATHMTVKDAVALADSISQKKRGADMTDVELALCVLTGHWRLLKSRIDGASK